MPTSSMTVQALENTMTHLARSFVFVTLDQAADILDGRLTFRRPAAVITFDDSLACLPTLAAPLLFRMGIPATFFVSTFAIDKAEPYWWLRLEYALAGAVTVAPMCLGLTGEELQSERDLALPEWKRLLKRSPAALQMRIVKAIEDLLARSLSEALIDCPFGSPMSWDDVRQLGKLGMVVGSHSVTHPRMEMLDITEIRQELGESRLKIESEVGVPCVHFCYPYGSTNREIQDAARLAGYRSAVTTESPGWNYSQTPRLALRRFGLPSAAHKLGYMLSRSK
ncbi:MAG: polysaccharide deacetylase family protein [Verrucomicrobiota bacterium]